MQVAQTDFLKEGPLAIEAVRISEDEAVQLARRNYGIEGNVRRFATEKDDTFCLTDRHGSRYTLKIGHPGERASEIALQIALLGYIASVDPTMSVPRVVPALDERLQFSIPDAAGLPRQVHLLTFINGTPLNEIVPTAKEREAIGESLAALRRATVGFTHEAESREIAWDIRHLLRLSPLLQEIENPERRHDLEHGLERFAQIEQRVLNLRTQVLHNDYNRSNIIVDRKSPNFVAGIIDFGDAVRTAIAIDASTALMNQLPQQETGDYLDGPLDVLRGYLRSAELTDDEVSLLPELIMARVVLRALLTTWRARMFPENATYILRSTEPGWHQLKWFVTKSAEKLSQRFVDAARDASLPTASKN